MAEFAAGEDIYSAKWLKQKLTDRYGKSLYFAEIDGRPNIVCFKSSTSSIINEKWYNEKRSKLQDVETAAKIILSEIRAMDCNNDHYPTVEDISKPR